MIAARKRESWLFPNVEASLSDLNMSSILHLLKFLQLTISCPYIKHHTMYAG